MRQWLYLLFTGFPPFSLRIHYSEPFFLRMIEMYDCQLNSTGKYGTIRTPVSPLVHGNMCHSQIIQLQFCYDFYTQPKFSNLDFVFTWSDNFTLDRFVEMSDKYTKHWLVIWFSVSINLASDIMKVSNQLAYSHFKWLYKQICNHGVHRFSLFSVEKTLGSR